MCGIFGLVSNSFLSKKSLNILVKHSRQRGRDSSGLIYSENNECKVTRADFDIKKLVQEVCLESTNFILGHSRLITNGLSDNQPVVKNDILLIHNGIIVNYDEIYDNHNEKKSSDLDSEVIAFLFERYINEGFSLHEVSEKVLKECKGTLSAAVYLPKKGKLILLSNNGSLYFSYHNDVLIFASEEYPLLESGCKNITNVNGESHVFDLPYFDSTEIIDFKSRKEDLIPGFIFKKSEFDILEYKDVHLKRCTKCILPETMPFISFDTEGVCNYCNSYKPRNIPKPKEELFKLVKPYRKTNQIDCIVPFSGGRDSCYGLHLIIEELKMKPVTYTYDWGMVTDLGRRNISRMCSKLGVENIIIAADISKKRRNIRMNLKAWLKSPHLGMMAMLTAGDKHFFRHVETVKKQTGVNLNLWGVNPLEVTHFKTGFLDIPPDFEEKKVYSHGWANQLRYHSKRTKAMLDSPGYFNRSLWDTLSGEYFRSFTEKKDYYHIFDYWRWDENIVDNTLLGEYDWEKAPDTSTTWRIGDGTAALYNYVYYTIAGFTEHDTFRSNQIREGDITRDEALALVKSENQPRYQNIKWYLDALDMDFIEVISVINSAPKLYGQI